MDIIDLRKDKPSIELGDLIKLSDGSNYLIVWDQLKPQNKYGLLNIETSSMSSYFYESLTLLSKSINEKIVEIIKKDKLSIVVREFDDSRVYEQRDNLLIKNKDSEQLTITLL